MMRLSLRGSWTTRLGECAPLAFAVLTLLFFEQPARATTPSVVEGESRSVNELAAYIDEQLDSYYARAGVVPAPVAGDAEFLRRVYLDIAGTIPTAGEVRRFLADDRPDKRQRIIAELMESPAYAENFLQYWLEVLLPEALSDQQLSYVSLEFATWLRRQLRANQPYNQWVRDILTVPLTVPRNRSPYMFVSNNPEPRPTAFFAAKNLQAEELAAATARVFLGLRVDCAQCHDHPFAHWRQEEFWAYAAFFQGFERSTSNPLEVFATLFTARDDGTLTITIPDTTTTVEAAYLDGVRPELDRRQPRDVVAQWITSDQNPYFARAAVNRLWAYLFGIGLVDPVDDMDSPTDARHAALLDGIAERFVQSGYDLKYLISGMLASRTYQLSRTITHPSQRDPLHFARKTPKKLTARQTYDSIKQAMLAPPRDAVRNPYEVYAESALDRLRISFGQGGGSLIERPTSVLEALVLMNGQLVTEATDDETGSLVNAIIEIPGLSHEEALKTLYLSVLCRLPTEQELAMFLRAMETLPNESRREYLNDVFWALLNSSEFTLN